MGYEFEEIAGGKLNVRHVDAIIVEWIGSWCRFFWFFPLFVEVNGILMVFPD